MSSLARRAVYGTCALIAIVLVSLGVLWLSGRAPGESPRLGVEVLSLFDRAATGLSVTEVEPASTAATYVIDSDCPLDYVFRIDWQVSDPDTTAPDERVGLELSGRLRLEIRAGEPALEVEGLCMFSIEGAQRLLSSGPFPAQRLDLRLSADGRHLQPTLEGDPSTYLEGFPGLATFWPAIPESSSVGARVRWEAPATRIVSDRLAGTPSDAVDVVLATWLEIDSHRAADLHSQWTFEDSFALSGVDLEMTGNVALRAVVLASGRLLHAGLDRRVVTSSTANAETTEAPYRIVGEIRLVAACDGPTLPDFLGDLTPAERVLAAWDELRRAVEAGDREAARALLDPALTRAHGEDAVLQTLSDHIATYGPASLGESGHVQLGFTEGNRLALDLRARLGGPVRELSRQIRVIAEVDGDSIRITRVESSSTPSRPRGDVPDAHFDLLLVSEGELHSGLPSR